MRLENIHSEMKRYTKSDESLVPSNCDTPDHIGNINMLVKSFTKWMSADYGVHLY